jgi:hypothetical protein
MGEGGKGVACQYTTKTGDIHDILIAVGRRVVCVIGECSATHIDMNRTPKAQMKRKNFMRARQ